MSKNYAAGTLNPIYNFHPIPFRVDESESQRTGSLSRLDSGILWNVYSVMITTQRILSEIEVKNEPAI